MRLPDWVKRYHAGMAIASTWPGLQYGTYDCCQLVGFMGLQLTGEDRRGVFGEYDSQASAEAILALYGGLAGLLTEAFGEPIDPKKAQRGDAVLIESGGLICGFCTGVYCAVLAPAGGLDYLPMAKAIAAWRL